MSKKVLVVGDTILDIYCYGSVERISPEAPVPVFDFEKEECVLGGATNVAANIRSLMRDSDVKIDYFGFYSLKILDLLSSKDIKCIGVPVNFDEILTKRRFVSSNTQLLRVDNHKKYSKIDHLAVNALTFDLLDLSQYDIIVVSDYDKNTLELKHFDILAEATDIPKIIDLKRIRPDMMSFANKNCILKCNLKEYDLNPHISFLGAKVVVTTGENGYWFPQTDERFPRSKIDGEVVDVVGAGDVFLAGMAVNFLESGILDPYKLCDFGNRCAGEKVKHFGTVAVNRKLL